MCRSRQLTLFISFFLECICECCANKIRRAQIALRQKARRLVLFQAFNENAKLGYGKLNKRARVHTQTHILLISIAKRLPHLEIG